MPDRKKSFEARDTEKMTPLSREDDTPPRPRLARRRPTPPDPMLESFLASLASKMESDENETLDEAPTRDTRPE